MATSRPWGPKRASLRMTRSVHEKQAVREIKVTPTNALLVVPGKVFIEEVFRGR